MKPTASKLLRLVAPEPGLVLETELVLEQALEQALALELVLAPVPELVLERALVPHIRQPTDRPTKSRR